MVRHIKMTLGSVFNCQNMSYVAVKSVCHVEFYILCLIVYKALD